MAVRFRRRGFLWSAGAVAAVSMVAVAGFVIFAGNDSENGEEHPVPKGAVNVCEKMSYDEHENFAERVREDFSEHEEHISPILKFVYSARSCDIYITQSEELLVPLLSERLTDINDEAGDFDGDQAWLPEFYADHLTLRGLFSAWAVTLNEPLFGRSSENFDPERFVEVLEPVSASLAMAADPERAVSVGEEYREQFRELGGAEVQLRIYSGSTGDWNRIWSVDEVGPVVHGWSVLAPLLRYGDFHEDFLTPVATDIVEFDQSVDGDWTVEGEESVSFDPLELDATDAMEPVLEALSRNLDAAEQVFDATGDPRVEELLDEVSDDD